MGSILNYVWLIVGFVLLIKGADLFVDGSSALARILKIPSVIIGLTIVAMGTSAPEAAVSITAGLSGNNAIAISNVLGSNMFNSLVVVGVCGAMVAFKTSKDILKRDLPVNIAISILLVLLVLDGQLSRIDGAILLVGMVIFIRSMIVAAKKDRDQAPEPEVNVPLYKCFIFIVIGVAAIIAGGQLTVDSASNIALSLGLSQTFVGLTIVAVGTSLPELVTSIVATRKGESGLALGNAVGSNIFNILFILGASSFIHPILVEAVSIVDAFVLVGIALMLYIFAKSNEEVSKKEGLFMVASYVAYTIYLLMR